MNSKIIKFVAGAGKTTYSINYMKENKSGLYLAFNNSVVNEICNMGLLGKTIDSLFHSFLLPKFISLIPLIGDNKKIKFVETDSLPSYLKGIENIKIDENGNIYNKSKKTEITLNLSNDNLHKKSNFTNSKFIKYIFDKNELKLTNELRNELSNYIIVNFPTKIIELLKSRFSYVIIDEAQDLNGYREKFAQLIHNSNIVTIMLGDENQNINNGGKWFELIKADECKNISFRCPENNCTWIRNNLGIDIYGNDYISTVNIISIKNVLSFDDGNKVLLYFSNVNKIKEIIEKWKGKKMTIKKAKGLTIYNDIVIIGISLNTKNLYTAITRTTRNVFSTVKVNCK